MTCLLEQRSLLNIISRINNEDNKDNKVPDEGDQLYRTKNLKFHRY